MPFSSVPSVDSAVEGSTPIGRPKFGKPSFFVHAAVAAVLGSFDNGEDDGFFLADECGAYRVEGEDVGCFDLCVFVFVFSFGCIVGVAVDIQ